MFKGTQIREVKPLTGLADVKILSFNPTQEELAELFHTDVDKIKIPEYSTLGEEGQNKLKLDVYVEIIYQGQPRISKMTFWLEDLIRKNKDGTKGQFINNRGLTAWAEDSESINYDWFSLEGLRQCHVGEERLYAMLIAWAGIDVRAKDSEVVLETPWETLVAGDVSELNNLIKTFGSRKVGAVLGVNKGYQDIFTGAFTRENSMRRTKSLLKALTGDYPWKSDYQDSLVLQEYKEPAADVELSPEEVQDYTGR